MGLIPIISGKERQSSNEGSSQEVQEGCEEG